MFHIKTAEKSCWQAVYLYWNNDQVAHIGVDPRGDYGMLGPRLFGGIKNHNFRIKLPYLNWKSNSSELRKYFYQKQNSFWHSLDGRF